MWRLADSEIDTPVYAVCRYVDMYVYGRVQIMKSTVQSPRGCAEQEASSSSVPSSPPSSHHVPFHHRQLGDWARAKRLEEILAVFPPDLR